jgi:hypothetical protein
MNLPRPCGDPKTRRKLVFDAEAARRVLDEHSIPEPNSGCLLWLRSGTTNFDYGLVTFAGKQWTTHRLSWMAEYGSIPKGLCVLHKCDVPACLNPRHLFLGTRGDNIRDMTAKGRHARASSKGQSHYRAKLTPEQVLAIRADMRPDRLVAIDYGVVRGAIGNIRSRRTWRHI